MNVSLPIGSGPSDEELCRLSRAGDRDKFGRIVERYRSLVCSVVFGACGRLAESEDLAEETKKVPSRVPKRFARSSQ